MSEQRNTITPCVLCACSMDCPARSPVVWWWYYSFVVAQRSIDARFFGTESWKVPYRLVRIYSTV